MLLAGSLITCNELTNWFANANCKTIDDLLPVDRLKLVKNEKGDKIVVDDGRQGGVRFLVECIEHTAVVVRALVDEVDKWNKDERARASNVVVTALKTEFAGWDESMRQRARNAVQSALKRAFGDSVIATIVEADEIKRKFGRRAVVIALINEIDWFGDKWWRNRHGQLASSLVELNEWSVDKHNTAFYDAIVELSGGFGEFDDVKGVAAVDMIKRALGATDAAMYDVFMKLFTKGAK